MSTVSAMDWAYLTGRLAGVLEGMLVAPGPHANDAARAVIADYRAMMDADISERREVVLRRLGAAEEMVSGVEIRERGA